MHFGANPGPIRENRQKFAIATNLLQNKHLLKFGNKRAQTAKTLLQVL
jgi:hypothetical protein